MAAKRTLGRAGTRILDSSNFSRTQWDPLAETQILREIIFPWRLVSGICTGESKPSQFQFYTVFQKLIHLPVHLGQAHTSSSTMNSHSMLSQDQHKVGSNSNKSGSWAQLETLLLGRDIQKDLWPERRFTKRFKFSQQVMFFMELSQLWEPKTVWFIIMFPIKSLSLEYPPPFPFGTNPGRLALFFWQVPSQNYMRTRPTALLRARRTWPVGSVNVHSGHPDPICSEGTSDPKITRGTMSKCT